MACVPPACTPAAARLAILLPVTSRPSLQLQHDSAEAAPAGADAGSTTETMLAGLRRLAASFWGPDGSGCDPTTSQHPPNVMVLLGIDSDDAPLLQVQQACVDEFEAAGVAAEVVVFSEADRAGHPPGAVCHLWDLLAAAAVQRGYNLTLLLGDDTEVSPPGWPDFVLEAYSNRPSLMLLLLNDAADPGFPSFPVLRTDGHLHTFGQLLPACFVNQGGDPFLADLYRRFAGCLDELPSVTVVNAIGGVQRSGQPYNPPRYSRHSVSRAEVLQQLRAWSSALAEGADPSLVSALQGPQATHSDQPDDGDVKAAGPHAASGDMDLGEGPHLGVSDGVSDGAVTGFSRRLAVDVLVPTYRLDLGLLQGIEKAVLSTPAPDGSDLHLVLVVDRAAANISPKQDGWLRQLQDRWGHRVRVRFNGTNLGASATRNRALQESFADFVIFFDDDISPTPGCIKAYVAAFKQHPEALGFAGPSFIPKDPGSMWCMAVHMSDVLFFWDAPKAWDVAEELPWAVTANVAFANTTTEFDLRFPKTGGGEDIDFCLKATAGRLVPVPEAAVRHPLWSNGRRCWGRFFGWAQGDGALIPMYPHLCYWAAPNSAEACGLLLLAAGAAAALGSLLVCAAALLPAAASLQDTSAAAARLALLCASRASLAAAVAYKTADMVGDVIRAFSPERAAKHPCSSPALRLAAAAEASLIKTASEAGRIWGHVCRGELAQAPLLRRFDWFCGLSPGVVRGEQWRAACRFVLCGCAAAVAAAAVAAASSCGATAM